MQLIPEVFVFIQGDEEDELGIDLTSRRSSTPSSSSIVHLLDRFTDTLARWYVDTLFTLTLSLVLFTCGSNSMKLYLEKFE